ncbi:TolC family outer membrane protein [soil metagenome]
MIRLNIIAILLFLLPVFVLAQTATVTLQEAVEIALENNYQLKQAQNNLELADTRVFSARADFTPSLNASFSGSRTVGRQFIEEDLSFDDRTAYSLSGNVNANLTVFNGFRNIANLRQARADKASQDESYSRLRESIIFNTASRYLQVVLNEELLKIAESSLEASRSQLEQVDAQVEVGARPTVDLFNQEALVANDELNVIQRENALEVSKAQLIRIMQDDNISEVETSVPAVDELSIMPVDLNLNEMIETALASRSDFRAQEYAIEGNRQEQTITRAQLLPTVTASAGINSRYSDQFILPGQDGTVPLPDQFFDQQINRFIGFSVSIPILNRWNNRTNLESARIQLRNSQLELENIRFQITEEVRQAYNDYQSIVKELDSSERARVAAERAYATEQQRYEIGSSTLIELNLANANYVQAQSERISAVYDFIFQEQLLDYFIGQLDSTIRIN